jgi:hypothetical protein
MRSKSFGERIADVLIEEGLLLPNQLEEAIGIQKAEGGRLLKVLTDRQFGTTFSESVIGTIRPRLIRLVTALSSFRASWMPETMRPEASRAW